MSTKHELSASKLHILTRPEAIASLLVAYDPIARPQMLAAFLMLNEPININPALSDENFRYELVVDICRCVNANIQLHIMADTAEEKDLYDIGQFYSMFVGSWNSLKVFFENQQAAQQENKIITNLNG